MVVADIFGPDVLIVIAVLAVVLLFGGAKLPKLARSLGSAKGEFEKGIKEGSTAAAAEDDEKDEPKGPPKAIESGTDTPSPQTRRDETTA